MVNLVRLPFAMEADFVVLQQRSHQVFIIALALPLFGFLILPANGNLELDASTIVLGQLLIAARLLEIEVLAMASADRALPVLPQFLFAVPYLLLAVPLGFFLASEALLVRHFNVDHFRLFPAQIDGDFDDVRFAERFPSLLRAILRFLLPPSSESVEAIFRRAPSLVRLLLLFSAVLVIALLLSLQHLLAVPFGLELALLPHSRLLFSALLHLLIPLVFLLDAQEDVAHRFLLFVSEELGGVERSLVALAVLVVNDAVAHFRVRVRLTVAGVLLSLDLILCASLLLELVAQGLQPTTVVRFKSLVLALLELRFERLEKLLELAAPFQDHCFRRAVWRGLVCLVDRIAKLNH